MLITQGTFAYLPPLSDDEIRLQLRYCIDRGWAILIEHTDDPHPRNVYWEMWKEPLFDLIDPEGAMVELQACRQDNPNQYVKVGAYDRSKGRQTTALSFIVSRPEVEPGFRTDRTESRDRQVRYGFHSYGTDEPAGQRYRRR